MVYWYKKELRIPIEIHNDDFSDDGTWVDAEMAERRRI